MTIEYEFRRRIDDVIYRFAPDGLVNGFPAWKRVDLDIRLIRHADKGWCTVDSAGTINGRPWNVEPEEQGAAPFEGEWVSKKNDKSYVYDLVKLTDRSSAF